MINNQASQQGNQLKSQLLYQQRREQKSQQRFPLTGQHDSLHYIPLQVRSCSTKALTSFVYFNCMNLTINNSLIHSFKATHQINQHAAQHASQQCTQQIDQASLLHISCFSCCSIISYSHSTLFQSSHGFIGGQSKLSFDIRMSVLFTSFRNAFSFPLQFAVLMQGRHWYDQ